MNTDWLNQLNQEFDNLHINQDQNNKPNIKIKICKNTNYNRLIKQHDIIDYNTPELDLEDREKEYQLVKDNLLNLNKFETTDVNLHKFVSYNLAKSLQYKKKICFNTNHCMYRNLNRKLKSKLNIIGKKVNSNISILKDKNLPKKYKLHHIKKLNKAIIDFVDDATFTNDEKIVRIKLKKLVI